MKSRDAVQENEPVVETAARPAGFDVEQIRLEFPILHQKVHGKPLVYLDNAATTQKPRAVIDATTHYYETDNSNIHRGVHALSERATKLYEDARVKLARFLGAPDARSIVFTRNSTEAINLVAQTFGRQRVSAGDEIILSAIEHHSNIVPWQILAEEKGAKIRVIPVDDRGDLILDAYEELFSPRTRLVAVTHMSNALGTIPPVERIVRMAHARGVPVLVDGSQAAYHRKVDLESLDCDFYVVTGHKLYGPTGIGALYGKREHLESMPPYQGGGDMIRSVTFAKTTWNDVPFKFEAGTPNIAGAIGLGAAIAYIEKLGMDAIAEHEKELLDYATTALSGIPDLRIIGTAREKASVLSFVLGDVHPHDVGTILDQEGIAVRTGHHCAQPVMERFGIPATVRASFALYNTKAEVDALVEGIGKVKELLG
ncbi:MAG TPA: cysteine desulfurase [Thermoanaerobaculia bacterium]|jgi:cysteine desulfurase/selenocysteine lyase|nr:cysteine desulfurase [Thermoanaerobaculia bacterium]